MPDLRPLTAGERAALELLEAARDAGDAVPAAELERAINSRFLKSLSAFAVQLGLRGYAPGVGEDGRWSIGYPKDDVERDGGEAPERTGKRPVEGRRAAPLAASSDATARKARGLQDDAGLIPRASAAGSLSAGPSRALNGAPDDGRSDAAAPCSADRSSGAPSPNEIPGAVGSGSSERLFKLPAIKHFEYERAA